MKRLDKPELTMDTIKAMEDMSEFIHAQIFDDLLIVAQKETNCFVLKTSEGLIVIDAIWPAREVYDAVIEAIQETGWNPADIKKLVLTHGHVDHTGCGRYFVENHHADTYLSKTDDIFWKEHPTKTDRPETWKDYEITNHVQDKDEITLGDKTIYVVETPGHTPGGLSYIFPVKENGEEHMAALWGGTTPPWYAADQVRTYLESLDYFIQEADKRKVDVALSNHTAFDNGWQRIQYSKVRLAYMPNIYIIGNSGFHRYCEVFRTMSNEMLERMKSEK